MRVFLLLISLLSSLAQEQFLPPVLSILASECRVTVESPIDIPAAPDGATGGDLFEIPVDLIVRFTAHQDVTMVHAHWGPPDFPAGVTPPTITGYEVIVNQTINGVLSHVSTTEALADDNSAHVAGNATFGEDTVIIASVTTLYEDENGNPVRSAEAVFPPSNTNCCPLMHPAPKFLPQPLDRADFVNEIDGGDYFVSVGGNLWTYFCHDGIYKSCFIIPDGFSDPLDNRFQEVGEVATFVRNGDGEKVDYVCLLRDTGNDDADDRSNELSGTFVQVPGAKEEVVDVEEEAQPVPPATRTGVMASESRVFDGNLVELDPTLHFIDAAHEAGDMPYTIPPAEVVRVQGKNEANRFHSHWEIPELDDDSPFTLTGFEISATQQDGTVLSVQTVGPDVFDIHILINGTDHEPFEVDAPKFVAPSGQTIVAQVVVLYEDESGNEVRSEPAFFPPSNSDACGCNFPPPKVLPEEFEAQASEGETDGGFYTVFNKGKQWTYYCNSGVYKSCFHPPTGFSDPLGQRFQEIGGQAFFQDDKTGLLVPFICMFSPDGDSPVPLDDIDGELSGRFIKGNIRDVMNTDSAASSNDKNRKALLATTIIFAVLSLILLSALIYTCLKRREDVSKASGTAGERGRKDSEMARTSYAKMKETEE